MTAPPVGEPGLLGAQSGRHARVLEAVGWGLVVLSLMEWWNRTWLGNGAGLVNSDLVVWPAVVEDVLIRGRPFFGAWHLTPAPYFVPDALLAVAARLLTGRLEPLMGLYVTGQVLLTTAALRLGLAVIVRGAEHWCGFIVATAMALSFAGVTPFECLWMPSYHLGVSIQGFVLFALVTACTRRATPLRLAGLIALVASGVASDALFIAGPFFGIAGVELWRVARSRSLRAATVVVGLGLGIALGLIAARHLVPFPQYQPIAPARLFATLTAALPQAVSFGTTPWLLIGCGVVGSMIWALRAANAEHQRTAAASALSVTGTLGAILITGALQDGGWNRYLLWPALLGMVGLVLLVDRRSSPWVIAAVMTSVSLWSLTPRTWALHATDEVPLRAEVRCLERVAARNESPVVIVEYWLAKPIALLSSQLTCAQLTPGFDDLRLWITSRAWFGPSSGLGVVVTNGFTHEGLARLPTPFRTERCGTLELRVFEGEARAALRARFDGLVHNAIGAVPGQ